MATNNAFHIVQPWLVSWTINETSGNQRALDISVNAVPTAASSGTYTAIYGMVKTNSAQNFSAGSICASFNSSGTGTGTAGTINAITASSSNVTHTTVTTVSGLSVTATSALGTVTTIVATDINFGATGGTVTSAIGLRVNAPTISDVTPTNVYGVYLGAISGGTNNYAIYAAAGDVHLQSGDLILNTAGKGIKIKTGSNATAGTATLVGGEVVVSTTKVTANSIIILTHQTTAGTAGFVKVSARSAGTSFTITSSSGTDTSIIGWLIIEPA